MSFKNISCQKATTFECYIIGEDSMVDRCAEIILEEGCILLGICSPNKSLKMWCEKNNIQLTDSIVILESWMNKNPGDFLFSVVNTKIIKKETIDRPRKFCINFHNAPLPTYAGVHATAWAILNREKYHGVTWHVLEEGVDTGKILKQEIFEIEKNETNFSLNMKCIEKGINMFRDLLKDLKKENYKLQLQDFNKRSYYTLFKKPKNYGIISWTTDSAEKISLLQRAMNFANYSNTFCMLKFVVDVNNNGIVPLYCGQTQITAKTVGAIPGEIIEISDKHLKVATRTKDIILTKLSDKHRGNDIEYSVTDLATKYGLKLGRVLPSMSPKSTKIVAKYAEELAKHESYWVKSFKSINKLKLFSANKEAVGQNYKNIPNNINSYSNDINEKNEDIVFATIILLYLYRLNNYDNYTIGYYAKCFNSFTQEVAPFFSKKVPLNVKLSPEFNFEEAFEYITRLLSKTDQKMTFSNDILLRYPSILSGNNFQINLNLLNDSSHNDINNFCFFINKNNNVVLSYPNDLDDTDQAIVENIPAQIKTFAENLLQNPKVPVKYIKLMPKKEELIIVDDFNDTKTDYPRDCSIVQIFEEQVEKYSDNIALKHGNNTLTYNELNCKANQIARYLISLGVQKGNIVAVYFNKGVNSVIGMLAVLKANAAYTPIDPLYPKEYVNYTLKDTNAYIILTQEKDRELLEDCLPPGKFIIFSVDGTLAKDEIFCKNSNKNLESSIKATELAYIMYTSGSTGIPKGVMIPNRGVVRLVKNTNYIKINSEDCFSQVSSISFDASTFEIWGALLNGARLVFADNDIITNSEYFSHFLFDEKISILTIVSAVLDRYASSDPSMFRNLKYIYVGGDILNVETVDRIINCSQGSPKYIINGYGPTENTNCTTAYSIPRNFSRDRSIPIGKAVANTSVYVVDKYFNFMPIGIWGELCTSGDGLALGYLNRTDLTAEKFIEAIIRDKKERIYRTGDSVRWLPDGNIDFSCRLDNQVKVRGFRIELEAIELQILNCNGIEQCVVVVKEKDNRKSLIAYIKPRDKNTISIANVRSFLKNELPYYMIPNTFVIVDTFPKLPNGKIDKKSLMKNTKTACIDAFAAPRNDIEVTLVNLWKELLDLDALGINENFFDLGGYSLLMTEMMVKVKEVFNKTFSLPTFLESPTIEKLASLLSYEEGIDINEEKEDEKLFYEDVFLPPFLLPMKKEHNKHRKNILLTGATGLVGSHLLYDFYNKTDANIYCLVRAIGIDDARQRLVTALQKHGLNTAVATDYKRIIPVLGDLSCTQVGMDPPIYNDLSGIIDEVFHCGAFVHHIYTYEMLHKINVLSTKEIIKFSVNKKLKKIHYISAISSAIKRNQAGKISENFLEEGDFDLKGLNGYARTKLASEIILSKANKCGVPVFIYRPAWIIGDNFAETNSLSDNHLLLLLRGCAQMKAAPRLKANLNLMPVGMVSSFIVWISKNKRMKSCVFNLINTNTPTWNDLIKQVQQQGYEIQVVSPDKWAKNYISNIGSDNSAYSLKPLYLDGGVSWANAQNEILNCCHDNYLMARRKINFGNANQNKDILDKCKIIL